MTEKQTIGICVIALLVAAVAGFFIGMGVGGHMGESPYRAEQQMIQKHVDATLGDKESRDGLACAVVAWSHTKPVDENWWQQCLSLGASKVDNPDENVT